MTGTRYPDMVCLSMCEEPAPQVRRQGGRPGAPPRNELPSLPPERPVVVLEYTDKEIGAMVRLACGLDGTPMTAWEIGQEIDLDEPMQIGRFLDTIRGRLQRRQSGNHGRPRSKLIGRPPGLTVEQKVKAVELYRGGRTMQEAADDLGVTLGQVRYVVTGT